MIQLKWLNLIVCGVLIASPAFAGTKGYTSLGGEKLFIQDAPDLGRDAFLIKFEGIKSKWANKVIQVKRTGRGDNSGIYSFDYDLELSSGVEKRTYQIVVEANPTLREGTITPQVELFYQEGSVKEPKVFSYSEALSKKSAQLNFLAEHKKKPFKPEVD